MFGGAAISFAPCLDLDNLQLPQQRGRVRVDPVLDRLAALETKDVRAGEWPGIFGPVIELARPGFTPASASLGAAASKRPGRSVFVSVVISLLLLLLICVD